MKLGELFFDLGFHADTMRLRDFGKAVADLNMSNILTAGSFGAVYEGATKLVDIANNMALGLNHFGAETGQSTQDLQRWGLVAEEAGVSAGNVVSGVKTLEDSIARMRFTGENSNIWAMLKLDPTNTKSIFDTLHQLGLRLQGMEIGQQRMFLGFLGLGDEWLDILPKIVANYSELSKITTMTTDSQKQMAEYQKTSADLAHNWQMTMADLGVSITPILLGLKEAASSLDENIIKSNTWKTLMIGIGQAITELAHPVKNLFGDYQKLAFNVFGPGGAISDVLNDPYGRMDPSKALGPASLPQISNSVSTSSPVTVNVKVNKAGPETTVETTTDQEKDKKNYSDIVNQLNQGFY